MSATTVMVERNDPSFYTFGDYQWIETFGNIVVAVAGEMRAEFTDFDGQTYTIRTAKDLDELGIDTDSVLNWLTNKGQLEWINNSWFEIYDETEPNNSHVLHDLTEALALAKQLAGAANV